MFSRWSTDLCLGCVGSYLSAVASMFLSLFLKKLDKHKGEGKVRGNSTFQSRDEQAQSGTFKTLSKQEGKAHEHERNLEDSVNFCLKHFVSNILSQKR